MSGCIRPEPQKPPSFKKKTSEQKCVPNYFLLVENAETQSNKKYVAIYVVSNWFYEI